MKLLDKLQHSLKGLLDAIARYPLTTAFLLAAAVVNALAIENAGYPNIMYNKLFVVFLVGAFLATVAQVGYERFFKNMQKRLILFGAAGLLTAGYFFIVNSSPEIGVDILVRTVALVFALLIAFIWIPSIKSKVDFTQSFMAAFKGFFVSGFFSGVLFGGISLILGAVDLLLFNVAGELYAHSANIVFTLFASLYFLSLIPDYNVADEEKIERAVSSSRFLEVLISNIIIPLASVFTVILISYIALNIGGRFWEENLLEPMLVSYSIVTIIILTLAANLDNRFANLFKKIFPKILIPIVLFQVIASVMKIGDVGITHSRYYVIMYGVFAIAAGAVYSFLKPGKYGIVAIVLICLSVVSTVPPIDAFSVSKRNQINTLINVLTRNDMLIDDEIIPRSDIDNQDKRIIINTTSYIYRMNYTEDVEWLPDSFVYYTDFEKIFGFKEYEIDGRGDYVSIVRNKSEALDVSGYQAMTVIYFEDIKARGTEPYEIDFAFGQQVYTIAFASDEEGDGRFYIEHQGNEELTLWISQIVDSFGDIQTGSVEISTEEATFEVENNNLKMKVVINHLDRYETEDGYRWNGEAYVMLGFND